jgi:hypothetical protein
MSEDSKFKKPEQYTEKTNAQLEAEVAAADQEMKMLDLEIKRETVQKIKSDRQAKFDVAESKRVATLQFLASRKANQDRCNHRKGGRGPDAVMRGQGDDNSYAIIRHRLPHSEYMVLCQRCGKEWMPANKWNVENGVLKPLPASPGWADAMQWPCDNSASTSGDFRFEKVEA